MNEEATTVEVRLWSDQTNAEIIEHIIEGRRGGMNKNQELHELLGKCWHEEVDPDGFCTCGDYHKPREWDTINPDYGDDPRLVLEAMRKAGKEVEFIDYLFKRLFLGKPEWISYDAVYCIVELIRDRTGKMADLAIEFLRKGK